MSKVGSYVSWYDSSGSLHRSKWWRWEQERPYNHENTDTRLLIEVKHDLVEVVLRWGTTLEFSMLFLKFPFAFSTSYLATWFFMHFIVDTIRFNSHWTLIGTDQYAFLIYFCTCFEWHIFFHFQKGRKQSHQVRKSGIHQNRHWKQKQSRKK